MIGYHTLGQLPPKPHIEFRSADGRLYHEHCLTRAGFERTYSILYHQNPPTRQFDSEISALESSPGEISRAEKASPLVRLVCIPPQLHMARTLAPMKAALAPNEPVSSR